MVSLAATFLRAAEGAFAGAAEAPAPAETATEASEAQPALFQEALERRLEAAIAEGRAAWPGVVVPAEAFVRHLARVVGDGDDPVAALDELWVADLYLAAGCVAGGDDAARAFERAMAAAARAAASRVDATPAFVQEVCAELRVRLLVAEAGAPRIASYLGRGPLRHWVQVSAMRLAQSLKRSAQRSDLAAPLRDDLAVTILEDDPEVGMVAREIRASFASAFSASLSELTLRERTVLRLYLVEDVSAETIGAMYRVHRATVARWIGRARRKVQAKTRERLVRDSPVTPTSLDSVIGLVMDGIDLSLASVLRPESPS